MEKNSGEGPEQTPRARLEESKKKLRDAPGNDVAQRQEIAGTNVDCAIEVVETMLGLSVALGDAVDRSVSVMNDLIASVDTATKQAAESAKESSSLAKESATLSTRLNSLTKWIVAAAILSALAAVAQAVVAVYSVYRSQQIIQIAAPAAQTSLPKRP